MTTTFTPVCHRSHLIILRAGDASLHPRWISEAPRDFDLFISYYGKQEDRYRRDAEYWEHRPGPKWSCIADLLESHPQLIDRYRLIWFPDDDLEVDTQTLNRMFALARGLNLKLAQPALTRNSYFSWPHLLQQPRYVARQVAFVEVMAPLFPAESLRICLPTFRDSRSGWGLDWVWPKLLGGGSDGRIAVLDATPVRHTRPIGGGDLYKSNPDLDPNQDSQRLAMKHGLTVDRFTQKFTSYPALAYVPLPLLTRIKHWIQRLNARRLAYRRSPRVSVG